MSEPADPGSAHGFLFRHYGELASDVHTFLGTSESPAALLRVQ